MDFKHSDQSLALQEQARAFLDEYVYPAEDTLFAQAAENRAAGQPFKTPAVLPELRAEARRRGLWNLFMPDDRFGPGLSALDYAPIAEMTGGTVELLGAQAMNCAPPDTGNMELLALFGTDEQQKRWLQPLLDAEIRSCFSMTEPAVASSDATNIALTITRDGDEYVVNGRKWWSSGAMRPECEVAIVLGVSDPNAEAHSRHTMVIVPLDTPGVTVERSTSVFGYDDFNKGGHGQIHFENARVPMSNVLGPEGAGFAVAQARLGPGRVHHCMRTVGMAERALELMCARVLTRKTFGSPLASQGVIREWIAESRIQIEQSRLLILKAAWMIDNVGVKAARTEIAAIKVAAPRAALYVIDRAIQAHGAAGVSADTPLAEAWAKMRILQIADGPDEVHKRSIGKQILREYEKKHPA